MAVRSRLLLLAALSLVACGDDDRVDPSNPDASAAKDATGLESGKDGARDAPEDVRSEGHHDAEADSGGVQTDGEADALAE
jgi:hypothetical protein